MVLSRQDAEALGIQLDPVEQPVEDEQGQVTSTEELEGMTEQVDQESEMQQPEDMNEYNSETAEQSEFHQELQAGIQSDLQSQLHAEFQSELQNDLQDELQHELQQDLEENPSQEAEIQPEIPQEIPSELQPKSQEPFPVTDETEMEPQVDTAVPEAISVPDDVLPIETQDEEVKTKEKIPKEDEEMQTTTVSLDSVSQQLQDGADGDSSANDVLSNIIQSLFNPNEPNQSNVSIVPRMVGGKRKLCLRLPASTASALLAQTGSPLAHSFIEGGIPKKIKIVIPPSSLSSSAGSFVTSLANSASIVHQEPKIVKIPLAQQLANNNSGGKTTGPARLDPDTLPNSSSFSLMSSPIKSSSKPFLASLFSSTSTTTTSASLTVTPVTNPPKKPLGSTENPIQLVQEGNSFRSLQPLTPDQLKHIASVLKQNRQAILSGDGKSGSGTIASSSEGDGGKRRVVFDAKSNTRIVYRVVTPGELKKTPTSVVATTTSNTPHGTITTPVAVKSSATLTPSAMTPTVVRGRGRGRGRPPGRTIPVALKRKAASTEESDSEDVPEDDAVSTSIDMSKVKLHLNIKESYINKNFKFIFQEEREGKKKLLPRTRSGRVSKPPRHMFKDYKRLHHLDFAQPDLDDSDGGYSDYRIDHSSPNVVIGNDESGDSSEDSKDPIKSVIPTSPFNCTTCKREYTTPHRYVNNLILFKLIW